MRTMNRSKIPCIAAALGLIAGFGASNGALGFLQKPFSVAALGNAVRAAMSGQRVTSP